MKRLLFILIAIWMIPAFAQAGGLIKVMNQSKTYLTPTRVEVSVEVNNQVAITVARQTFKNTTGDSVVMKYGFPMPLKAVVTGFNWDMNGKHFTAQIVGQPMDTTATNPGGYPDYTYLDYFGKSPFFFTFLDTLPPDSELVVHLTYMELLSYNSGKMQYDYPLDLGNFEKHPLDSLAFSVTIHSQRTLVDVNLENFTPQSLEVGDTLASLFYSATSFSPNEDLAFTYKVSQKELGVFLLSMKPDTSDGYFLMLAEPNPETSQGEILDKYFTFVIDKSGSMKWVKMQQAKDAASYCLRHLNEADHFNIISFSDGTSEFRQELVPATQNNINSGVDFVNAIQPGGGTNIHEALLKALNQSMPDTTENIIIFLTDGVATVGTTDSQQILDDVKAANTKNVRLFVFGVGADVERYLLTSLAEQNDGLAQYVMDQGDVRDRIAAFYNKIQNPLLQNISVAFNGGDVYEVYPVRIPDIFVGEQLVLLGRYKTPGAATVTLSGRGVKDSLTFNYDVTFSGDSTKNLFIPKMWAKKKIDYLLALIDIVGENSNQGQEYKKEIIRLSILYGIVTKYTSFQQTQPNNPPGTEVEQNLTENNSPPEQFQLLNSYPNPFMPENGQSFTHVVFKISGAKSSYPVEIRIYDVTGRLILVLVQATYQPGHYEAIWNGRDQWGHLVSSGVYLVKMKVGAEILSTKILIIR
ncbi:MAG: VWA domain-containing protein [Calditrichaeota bacterium]|nr:VWA domain-containing protein [Calditrichota bacterium]